MAAKEQHASAKFATPNINPAQFAEMGQKQVDAMVDMQKELIGVFEEVNREWTVRAQAEAELATEFAGKLSAARSGPDMATIYQEWLTRRMEMFSEDSRRAMADSQKFMAAATRLLSNGWTAGRSGS